MKQNKKVVFLAVALSCLLLTFTIHNVFAADPDCTNDPGNLCDDSTGSGGGTQSSGGGTQSTGGGTQSPGGGTQSPGDVPKVPNPLKGGTNTIYEFVTIILNDVVLPIGSVICVLAIIYAGYMIVTARGDETKLEKGKWAFVTAVIGTAILLGSVAISQGIQATLNQLTH